MANGVVLKTDDLSSHLIMPLLLYMKSSLDEIHPSLVLLFNPILWVRLSEPEMLLDLVNIWSAFSVFRVMMHGAYLRLVLSPFPPATSSAAFASCISITMPK